VAPPATAHRVSVEAYRITLNLAARLLAASRGGPCRVFSSDMKVALDPRLFYYPDVMVVCDPTDVEPYFKSRPCLLVEVLSPATEIIDRREKLYGYRRLPSLEAYVLVDQVERRVELYRRDEAGDWRYEIVEGQGAVALPCVPLTMPLDEIYEGLIG